MPDLDADGLLETEITGVLPSLNNEGLRCLIEDALGLKAAERCQESGKKTIPWPLLPPAVCEAVSGSCQQAIPAAAALQFLWAAADALDDIEDDDSAFSLAKRYGTPLALNAATTLVILAEREIARLGHFGVKAETIVAVYDSLNQYYTTACTGQHLDLSLAPGVEISEDDYLKVASMKSATTIECACHIGALLANSTASLADAFGRFGHDLGMASQIANDIEGITGGRDISRRKKTLPIIFALAHTEGRTRNRLLSAFSENSTAVDPAEVCDTLFRSGAMFYSLVRLEIYSQHAKKILAEIEAAGINTLRLVRFLDGEAITDRAG